MKYGPSIFALATLFTLGIVVGTFGMNTPLTAITVVVSLSVLLPFLPFVAEYDRKKHNGNGHDVRYMEMLGINLLEYGSAVAGIVLGVAIR